MFGHELNLSNGLLHWGQLTFFSCDADVVIIFLKSMHLAGASERMWQLVPDLC